MTSQDIKKRVKSLEKMAKKVAASKTASRDFLVKAGICTPKGKLTRHYSGK